MPALSQTGESCISASSSHGIGATDEVLWHSSAAHGRLGSRRGLLWAPAPSSTLTLCALSPDETEYEYSGSEEEEEENDSGEPRYEEG